MNNCTLVGSQTEQLKDNQPIIKTTEILDKSKKTKLKILLGLFCLVLLLIIGYPIIDSLLAPKPIPIPTDTQKLDSLIGQVVKGKPLQDGDWADLCDLLASVKGMNINDCDSCHDYLRALLGGKHYKWMLEYLNKHENELKRGIRSIEKQIIEHQNKILDPQKYCPDWDNIRPLQKEDLVKNKWNNDIKRQKEQKQILECILKNRKK
jgi:hypothetical protein